MHKYSFVTWQRDGGMTMYTCAAECSSNCGRSRIKPLSSSSCDHLKSTLPIGTFSGQSGSRRVCCYPHWCSSAVGRCNAVHQQTGKNLILHIFQSCIMMIALLWYTVLEGVEYGMTFCEMLSKKKKKSEEMRATPAESVVFVSHSKVLRNTALYMF